MAKIKSGLIIILACFVTIGNAQDSLTIDEVREDLKVFQISFLEAHPGLELH